MSGTTHFDPYLARLHALSADDPRFGPQQRTFSAGAHLITHLHQVPVLVFPCIEGRVENAGPGAQAGLYGSIFPATWSLMLALRARGIGSVMMTWHLHDFEREVARILEIPEDITQAGMIAAGYFTGTDFKPAKRRPTTECTHWNTFGTLRP